MSGWQFTDATGVIATRTLDDGSIESRLAASLPANADIAAAPEPELADYQRAARLRIDADVDAVFADVVGNRATEYQIAKDDAIALKNAGYSGAIPASVLCWATVKGWTAQQAADDILATATNWLNAQQSMRANRLARKQEVTTATDLAGVDAALSAWATYIAGIRSQLGV